MVFEITIGCFGFMLSKRMPHKRYTLCEIVCLFAAVYFICYILRQDGVFPISIGSAWYCISHWVRHFHVVAVALLPIYVAFMVFGTAAVGIYLGSATHRWLNQLLQK